MRFTQRIRLLIGAAAVFGTLAGAWAQSQTFSFLGSPTASWTPYAGSTQLPALVTTTPGSIVDDPAPGYSFARTTDVGGAFSGGYDLQRTFSILFSGVLSNTTTLRLEFSNPSRTRGLQVQLVNATVSGQDSIQVTSLGAASGGTDILWSGNLGGAGNVGKDAYARANLTFAFLPGGKASITGTISDINGSLWSGQSSAINLGAADSPLYAALNTNGKALQIDALTYTMLPEPGSLTLFSLLGVLVFGLRRRVSATR
jgi:hypothetical protein